MTKGTSNLISGVAMAKAFENHKSTDDILASALSQLSNTVESETQEIYNGIAQVSEQADDNQTKLAHSSKYSNNKAKIFKISTIAAFPVYSSDTFPAINKPIVYDVTVYTQDVNTNSIYGSSRANGQSTRSTTAVFKIVPSTQLEAKKVVVLPGIVPIGLNNTSEMDTGTGFISYLIMLASMSGQEIYYVPSPGYGSIDNNQSVNNSAPTLNKAYYLYECLGRLDIKVGSSFTMVALSGGSWSYSSILDAIGNSYHMNELVLGAPAITTNDQSSFGAVTKAAHASHSDPEYLTLGFVEHLITTFISLTGADDLTATGTVVNILLLLASSGVIPMDCINPSIETRLRSDSALHSASSWYPPGEVSTNSILSDIVYEVVTETLVLDDVFSSHPYPSPFGDNGAFLDTASHRPTEIDKIVLVWDKDDALVPYSQAQELGAAYASTQIPTYISEVSELPSLVDDKHLNGVAYAVLYALYPDGVPLVQVPPSSQ